MRRVGLLFLAVWFGSGCPEEETLVLTFDEEPRGAASSAPSGEVVAFDPPPIRKASTETLPAPTKIEPTKLPQVKQETASPDPHANVPNYKEMGEARKQAAEAVKLGDDPRVLFMNHCAVCHNFDGSGQLKKPIAGIPDLSAPEVQTRLKDSDIYKAIANGHGGAVGYASMMNGEQINGVVEFVRALRR